MRSVRVANHAIDNTSPMLDIHKPCFRKRVAKSWGRVAASMMIDSCAPSLPRYDTLNAIVVGYFIILGHEKHVARRWPSCCARPRIARCVRLPQGARTPSRGGYRSRLTKLCGGYIFRQQALLRSVNLDKVIGCREAHSYACRFRQTSLAPTWLTSSLGLGARIARPRETHLVASRSENALCYEPRRAVELLNPS